MVVCRVSLRTIQRVNAEIRQALVESDEDLHDKKSKETNFLLKIKVFNTTLKEQRADAAESGLSADICSWCLEFILFRFHRP